MTKKLKTYINEQPSQKLTISKDSCKFFNLKLKRYCLFDKQNPVLHFAIIRLIYFLYKNCDKNICIYQC